MGSQLSNVHLHVMNHSITMIVLLLMFDYLDLQFRLVMAEEQIIVDKRRYSFAKSMETERRLKQEAAASWYSCNIHTDFPTSYPVMHFNSNSLNNKCLSFSFLNSWSKFN